MSTTRVLVRDVELPTATAHRGGGTLALLTLDNGADHRTPSTLGPETIAELTGVLLAQRERAAAGEIVAVAVTGKPYVLAAGADLKRVSQVASREQALDLGRGGHEAYALLADLGVPSFAFVNGVALGGGLELTLSCTYRTVSGSVHALGLPETSLGLVPGWGGAYLLPRLIGIEAAVDVVLRRPAANKPLSAHDAAILDLVDRVLDPADFLEQSIAWAAAVLRGEVTVPRRELDSLQEWDAVVAGAREHLDAVVGTSRPAPHRALELMAAARTATQEEAYAAEDEALADLIMTDEMRASVYAFGLVTGAKRPVGAPDAALARKVRRVGIVGAGLMAAQIALLVSRRLKVPVVMRDLDDERVAAGIGHVASEVEKAVRRGRLTPDAASRVLGSVTGTTDLSELAGCDLVIEAVTERLDLKKRVFAELEDVIDAEAVLATNTSALSVTAMAADLRHPERVVGLHFFNPVAAMPLVEVIRAGKTDEATYATAFAVTKALGKSAVASADRPGFIVNRLLVLLMGRIVGAVEGGTPVAVADRACDVLGLPMPPFQLFDLVGPAVGLHVLTSLREELGDAFPHSPGLERIVAERTPLVGPPAAPGRPRRVLPEVQDVFDTARGDGGAGGAGAVGSGEPLDEAGVLDDVLTALTREIRLMLDEGVVQTPSQIDTAMILGAGWPFHLGGITPYLDRTGYSERVAGQRFLPRGVADVPPAG
ncbi:3-hydroxyacyl-CoA dehydrogenase NAD-binding domain-containing protein [Serinibacter arcticus]|uniref:Enoyl-CoA hydratase n=1 Tax=Serinibacter arcticus TaxID=1655435 RepID=A0A4Z1DZ29_9MICO|nr:3-hydroxyacyl-CoA dehydrogenase NAD-binding domain-containing protein [Serinibacter arcticus]TGO04786.1 Enoyl-CoA hydratase [Serinibacter arcticus]